jgi:hypothetical protein
LRTTYIDEIKFVFHDERGECQLYFPARLSLDRVEAVDERITGIVHSVVVGEVERLDRPTIGRQQRTSPASCMPNQNGEK